MVRESPVAFAPVGEADPQRRHRAPPHRGGGVQRLAAAQGAHAEPGLGAEVPRSVGHDHHVRAGHLLRCEQGGPDGHRLELTAERLPARDPRVDQPGLPQPGDQPRERPGERRAVGQDVGDPGRAPGLRPRSDRPDHRVQRRAHDRRALQPRRRIEDPGVGLLHARHGGLQRHAPRLHHTAGGHRGGRVAFAVHGHDEVDASRPEPQLDRRDVQQDPVAPLHRPDQVGVRQPGSPRTVHLDLELDGAGARVPDGDHRSPSQRDHLGHRRAGSEAPLCCGPCIRSNGC